MSAWVDLAGIPAELRMTGEPAEASLFFDTSGLAAGDKCIRFIRKRGGGLISAIVLSEWLARSPTEKRFTSTIAYLQDQRLRVVSVDADVIETYWRLTRSLRFDTAPIRRHGETEGECRKRLAADLMIFATSLRHRRMLITNNTRDFENFGYRAAWKTLDEAIEILG